MFTDHFSGPNVAVGPLYVFVTMHYLMLHAAKVIDGAPAM